MQDFNVGGAVYSAKFNPSDENLIGCVSNENFGIRGCGFLSVLSKVTGGTLHRDFSAKYSDALFDFCWLPDNLLVACAGDGTISFWIPTHGGSCVSPLKTMVLHSSETHGIDAKDDQLISCGWDGKLNVVDTRSCEVLRTFSAGHVGLVYSCCWNRQEPSLCASSGSDHFVRIWDPRSEAVTARPQLLLSAHNSEVLTCAWADGNSLYSGDTLGCILAWDRRWVREPTGRLMGHRRAVRRIVATQEHRLLSAGYDFAVTLWADSRQIRTWQHHTEFVYGVDFCMASRMVLDGAWDGRVCLYPAA